jgi:hypothetical protein
MPRFDQRCQSCTWTGEVIAKPHEMPPCPQCGNNTARHYPIGGHQHSVIGDEFVGGQWIENLDTTPVFVESRSQFKREMKARGLEQKVRHIGTQDSDKSQHTTRWF